MRAFQPQSILHRAYSTSRPLPSSIIALLDHPAWSLRSLLPSSTPTHTVTSSQLHHLLRLSALPPPSSPADEERLLADLHAQLHFVRAVQAVDTTGVRPLVSVRDESDEGRREKVVGLGSMREALEKEEVVGTRHPRIRRRGAEEQEESWDVLGQAPRRVGRFFVVEAAEKES